MTESDSVRPAGRRSALRTRLPLVVVVAAAVAIATAPRLRGRQPLAPPPAFRSGINLVTVDVVVRTDRGLTGSVFLNIDVPKQ